MGLFRAKNGKIYIEPNTFNYDLWRVFKKKYRTQGEFTLQTGITRRVVENLNSGRPVNLETVKKFVEISPELTLSHWIFDYDESVYQTIEEELDNYIPTNLDIKDCATEIISRRKTIEIMLNGRIDEGRMIKIKSLVDRIILEAEYMGCMRTLQGKEVEITKKIQKVRNAKGVK